MPNPAGILSKIGKATKKATTPAFGGSYDNAVIRRAKEEFVTTHGMDVGQSLSKDYDFINIDKIKPAEKVNEKHVKELMNALEAEDPFNTKIPPVIIDSDGNVLDGHHRIEAAKRLGIKSVPAIEKFETQSGTNLIDAIEQSKANGGVVDLALKAWHEKKMAAGGRVMPPEVLGGGTGLPMAAGGASKLAKAAVKAGKKISGAAKVLPEAERKANLEKMLSESAVKGRVYHGTQRAPEGIQSFEVTPGMHTGYEEAGSRPFAAWFTDDPEEASRYAEWIKCREPGWCVGNPTVYPSYLNIKNPVNADDEIPGLRELIGKSTIDFETDPYDPEVISALKRLGYDGIKGNYYGENKRSIYIPFDPKQIKSATGNIGTYDPTTADISKAAGGDVHMAAGGDPYQEQQQYQAKKSADVQAYKQGKLGADDLVKYFPGMTAAMVEAQLQTPPQAEPQMAGGGSVDEAKKVLELIHKTLGEEASKPLLQMMKGGEVRMQMGGNPAQIQALLAEGVPVQMSRGPEGSIARGLIEQQEAERRRKEEERRARVARLPLSERLGGMYEAGRTLQSVIGQEIAKPFVGLIGGEQKIKELEEGTPLPQTEAGAEYLGRAGEALGTIGKVIEPLKIPDVPFLPEVGPGYIPGLGRQISSMAGKAAEKIGKAVPEQLKNLPVGASTESVGPGGEKVSINELIRRLEAGEEMTPAERQKAEYSKAAKEKYAQANIARAQKQPAPQEEEVRIPATEQGFFSSVEKAAANLKREEGSGDAFLSDIMKFNPSKGELEATGIVNFLKGKENLTKQDIVDYINNNQIQIEEVVRGHPLNSEERRRFDNINRKISQGYEYAVSPKDEEWFEATRARISGFKQPRFEDERLILPGGENYKELLLKFPMRQNVPVSTDKSAATMLFENNMKEKYGGETFPSIYNRLTPDEVEKYDMYIREDINTRKTESILQDKRNNFRHQHWPDDPNTFAHVRMQDMEIGGKRTLLIEEIQSDWHQQGRKKGYGPQKETEVEAYYETPDGKRVSVGFGKTKEEAEAAVDPAWKNIVDVKYDSRERVVSEGVPDAAFKKDWYQLAIKRIMKYAADNDYDQVALVGPNEQIRRGSLDTYVDGLSFQKNKDGTIKLDAEKNGSIVLNKTVDPEDLELNVGKDVAKRILESKETDGTLTGDDLKVGGEGMRQYYDRNYPKYLEKQYNKYGINLRKKELNTRGFDIDDVESDEVGEVDRFGRPVMGYSVRDPESGDIVGYGTSIEEALNEANRNIPKTDIWIMDLPAKLKSDVKIGQSYKKGGLVKDRNLQDWHKKQTAKGGMAWA